MIEVQKDNVKLFLKLFSISKYSHKAKISFSNDKKIKKRFNRIDNSIILHKLVSVKSSLKLEKFEKDFQNHLEYVQLGQRLRLPKIKN